MTKKAEIVVIIDFPFPSGIAATNRLISYCKLFVSKGGKKVRVYITKPTEKINNVQNEAIKGIYEGIEYEFLANTTIWPDKNKLKRILYILNGYFVLFFKILFNKPEVIITYTSNFYTKKILLFLKKYMSYKLYFEETEYPKVLNWKGWKNRTQKYLLQYKKADGMIVMTKELYAYYSSLNVKRLYHLPMTVDIDRFDNYNKSEIQNYFIYVGGDGGFLRDGISDIVKGFKHAIDLGVESQLYLVGGFSSGSKDYQSLLEYIKDNNLESNIILAGKKKPDEIPGLLMHAKGIIMAPPKNFPSGGFPTKLGEFLASSRPVICTNVSEIANYLENKSCFLVEPGNVMQIGEAINIIYSEPLYSNETGMRGREIAIKEFNSENHIHTLMEFIYSN